MTTPICPKCGSISTHRDGGVCRCRACGHADKLIKFKAHPSPAPHTIHAPLGAKPPLDAEPAGNIDPDAFESMFDSTEEQICSACEELIDDCTCERR